MSTAVVGSFEHDAPENPHRPYNNPASLTQGFDDMLFSIPDLGVTGESLASPSFLQPPQYENTHSQSFSSLPHLNTQAGSSSNYERSFVSPSRNTFEPDSATSVSSGSPEAETSSPKHQEASSKQRRRRPKVELAPNQPLTTQGKPRTRVFSACLQCRSRKTRCDGGKPRCINCSKRPDEPCSYDVAPNRRGPDREPGARQRVKDAPLEPRRRRRRTVETKRSAPKDVKKLRVSSTYIPSVPPISPSGTPDHHPLQQLPDQGYDDGSDSTTMLNEATLIPGVINILDVADPVLDLTQVLNAPLYSQDLISPHKPELFDSYIFGSSSTSAYIEPCENEGYDNEEAEESISSGPSLDFSRQTWWDALLSTYTLPGSSRGPNLTSSDREVASQQITADIRFLFRSTHYWFCFFNVPRFFSVFSNPEKRARMQPSLVLAALAISTFLQSSEVEMGAKGRKKAMRMRDEAQGALDASLNAGWLDESLVQAAWLIAFFEICAHPYHSSQRVISAMVILDSLVRTMGLTSLDAGDSRTTIFAPGAPPVVQPQSTTRLALEGQEEGLSSHSKGCQCAQHSLGSRWSMSQSVTPLWVSTPAWSEDLSESEMRKEECRRLVWSSVMLVAGHSSYSAAHLQSPSLDLFMIDPANYSLLFPGESVRDEVFQAKDSIWSLYVRAMMLWNSCLRLRRDSSITDSEKAQFAMTAWLESYAIDDALNKHTCDIERSYMFLGREYLFNTRMAISYEFQRFVPYVTATVNPNFNRKKAEEWLTHQATVVKHLMFGLHRVTGQAGGSIVHRPFFVFWFMGQISRALTLWNCDNTLTVALDVSKAMIVPVEYLMSLWPCNTQRLRYESLRERLEKCCIIAGVAPPPMPEVSLGHFAS